MESSRNFESGEPISTKRGVRPMKPLDVEFIMSEKGATEENIFENSRVLAGVLVD